MKDELIKIMENPPDGGWKDRKQMLDIAIPRLEEFHKATGQAFPLFENIPTSVNIWLRKDQRIIKAFSENSADPIRAIYDSSEKSSDPNSNFGL